MLSPGFPPAILLAGAMVLSGGPAAAPCIRPAAAGLQVQGDVRICPGRYWITDRAERGVLIAASSNTRIDLTGVTLQSGDTLPGSFTGIGVASDGVNNVTVTGGVIRGYRYGIRLSGGRGHRIREVDVSGSRAQRLRSTAEMYTEADWLDIFRPEVFDQYGGGISLRYVEDVSVTGVTARGAQNGIGLFGVRRAYVADNDVSGNTGWGIHLWRSAHNTVAHNKADHNVRCESAYYRRGCDSAALLLREESDSNTIVENDLSHSGDGFFLSGDRPRLRPSVGNLVLRNDATGAFHNAFESTFSWGNTFIDNHADSSGFGFWLGYSTGTTIRGNTVLGSATAGIAIEHGSDNTLSGNVIIGGKIGIWLFASADSGDASRGYRIDDNVLANLGRGMILERTTQVKLRGNLFDGVQDGLVVDSVGRATEVTGNVFLHAALTYIQAPDLMAGSNYWGTPDAETAAAKVRGRVTIMPWWPASAAGY